jgi:acetyl esterase/lipase
MGHSAGAYNALMLGLDPEWLRGAGADPRRVAGVIGLAGPYDFLPIDDAAIIPIFPEAGPDTQPITYARADAPPLLLLTGTDDRQVKPRNTQALADRMRAVGGQVRVITYAGIGHIGLITAIAPAFSWRAPVLRDVMGFIDARNKERIGGDVPASRG